MEYRREVKDAITKLNEQVHDMYIASDTIDDITATLVLSELQSVSNIIVMLTEQIHYHRKETY